jgi:L-seryl-tRNA(Ser) seleniumtransferase
MIFTPGESESMPTGLRSLPSVDRLLALSSLQRLCTAHGRELVADTTRSVLAEVRIRVAAGQPPPRREDVVSAVVERVSDVVAPSLRGVINATGVILHTNLGRAPLSEAALTAAYEVGKGYSNLEFDLIEGERGSRYVHATGLLRRLTGAESALVVNNNAAAVLLMLSDIAKGREVIISRGQLVEVGGGFRVPEVMAASGATLVEVGTTNRTSLLDYAAAMTENTAALLWVHTSNFRQIGFTHQAGIAELAALAHDRCLPLLADLGSGALLETAQFGVGHEPAVGSFIAAGADLATFSGDKLLGGPQAGLIVGKEPLVDRLAHNPLTRALRVDKTTIAALQGTLLAYVRGRASQEIPIWRMISAPLDELEPRARGWAEAASAAGLEAEVIGGESTVGGGSLPGETIPTRLLALTVSSPDQLAVGLRVGRPPVIARIEGGRILFDPRTVLPEQDRYLVDALLSAARFV